LLMTVTVMAEAATTVGCAGRAGERNREVDVTLEWRISLRHHGVGVRVG
jgi:hypothetical protein